MSADIPTDWAPVALGDLVAVQKGRKVRTSAIPKTGYEPYLGAAALEGEATEYCDPAGGVRCSPTDVLILWDGERSGLVGPGRSGVVSSTVARLTPRDLLDSRFLLHQLRHAFPWIQAQRTGTGVPHVPADLTTRLSIPLPPGMVEQRCIAEILDTVDEAIRRTEQLIAKMKQVKRGLLHDLLTRGIDDNGELRDPERQPGQFKDSPLGTIPRAWEASPFRPYGATDRAYLKTGPFGSSLKQEHWVPEGVPVITIGALGEGAFTESDLLHVSEETARSLAVYAVMPGDIVFSRVADVGRSVVVGERQRGWLISSNLMWIALDQRRASPSFAQANISANPLVRAQIRRFVNSAGRDVANAAVLNSLILPWPSLSEQERIATVCAAQEERLAREVAEADKLRLLRQGLMEDLLSGRVRVAGQETVA